MMIRQTKHRQGMLDCDRQRDETILFHGTFDIVGRFELSKCFLDSDLPDDRSTHVNGVLSV